jgi:alcohol dehydrogenase class IV
MPVAWVWTGYKRLSKIAQAGIALVTEYLPKIKNNPQDKEAREALCLAGDSM